MKSALSSLLFMLLFIVTFSGCGNNIKATGQVVFEDETPLDRGIVVLQNAQYQYVGDIQPDGSFRLGSMKPGDGLPEGTYQAAIRNALDDNEESLVDKKFADVFTSGLVCEIRSEMKPIKIVVAKPVIVSKKKK